MYYIINWFYIYSFFGWAFESTYVSIKNKKVVNRGFVTGPLCTIYGTGAVLVYLIMRPFSDNILLLYIGGIIVPTILEYVTAVIMETLFHTSWWDYSYKKFNYKGRICLGSSLAWGFFTVILFYILQPAVDYIVALYPVIVGEIGIIAVTIMYAADFTTSIIFTVNFNARLEKIHDSMEDIYGYIKETRVYEASAELKEKMDMFKSHNLNMPDIKSILEEKLEVLTGSVNMRGISEQSKELIERFEEFGKKYSDLTSKKNLFHRRFMKAYPNMKSNIVSRQEGLDELRKIVKQRKDKNKNGEESN